MTNNKKAFPLIGATTFAVILIVGTLSVMSSKEGGSKDLTTNTKGVASPKIRNEFLGEKGKTLQATNAEVHIKETEVADGNIHFYNYYSNKYQKTVYFFVIKADDGTYRVAANACESCFGSKKGFTQVGNLIRCENCKITYSKNQIAQEKGGCNPRPIDKDANIKDGNLIINLSDIENSAELF